jgi:hypothetical protein
MQAMDYRKFDRLTQRLSAAGSRRQALRAVLGAALVGTVTDDVAAKLKDEAVKPGKECRPRVSSDADLCAKKYPVLQSANPEFCCPNGSCSCGGQCNCENACFIDAVTSSPFCCKGRGQKNCVSAETETCCGPRLACETCEEFHQSGISGSYRRR